MGINDPFANHSLSFTTSKKSLEEVSFMRREQKTKVAMYENQLFQKKREMVEMYRENYGIHVNNIKLQNLFKQTDDRGVYLFLEKRLREKKEFLAAEAIQKIVKGWITRRWWYPIREKRRVASTRLQMYWRRYYRLYVVIPRQRIALKHELAPLI